VWFGGRRRSRQPRTVRGARVEEDQWLCRASSGRGLLECVLVVAVTDHRAIRVGYPQNTGWLVHHGAAKTLRQRLGTKGTAPPSLLTNGSVGRRWIVRTWEGVPYGCEF